MNPRKPLYVFCDGSTGALDRTADSRPYHTSSAATGRRRPTVQCAAAAVARSGDGAILAIEWQVLPAVTNNEAEYAGLLLGIQIAHRLHAQATVFVLDSETVVGQMTGRCGVNSSRLKSWHIRACTAVRGLPCVRYQAVPREFNRLADGAAGQAAIAWEELMSTLGASQGGG